MIPRIVWITVQLSVICRLVGLCPPFICHSRLLFLSLQRSLVTHPPTRRALLEYCLTHLGYFHIPWPRTSVQLPVTCTLDVYNIIAVLHPPAPHYIYIIRKRHSKPTNRCKYVINGWKCIGQFKRATDWVNASLIGEQVVNNSRWWIALYDLYVL